MKVLMIPSWYPTPNSPLLGTFYREQAEALVEKGVQVAVAHVSVGSNIKNTGIHREVVNGVLTYIYTRPNLTPRWEYGRRRQRTYMLEALYRRIEKEWGRPDVVNLRSSLHGHEAIWLCKRHNLPLFFMEHSSYVITEPKGSPALKRLEAVMNNAAVNACVSNALRNVMQPFGETRVIPDPVDGDLFTIKNSEHDGFVFRAMGQLRPIKGYDILIRAFSELKKRTEKPVTLEIAGTGILQGRLQSLINELGLEQSCFLVGPVQRDKVPDFMNGCDCFICSSRVETLSCVLNEAAACGKPVISTRCGGPLDIVTEETGLLVPVDDIGAMTNAMLEMTEKAKEYDSNRIRQLTLERFGKKTVCDRLIRACADAIEIDNNSKDGENKTLKKRISLKLLLETLKIGMVTIGGGFAMVSLLTECYSEKYKWLTKDEMMDALAVAQSLPGPIGLNAAVIAGHRAAGLRGGLAAGLGMTLPPLVVMSLIATGYTWFRTNVYVAAAFQGIQASVCGLLAWATLTLGKAAIKKGRGIWTVGVFALSLVLTLFTRIHALFLIVGGLLVGLAFNALFTVLENKRDK
jgi:glycosyltransferase involved in cell wall biosynthesis/chromate transport protein ChrA